MAVQMTDPAITSGEQASRCAHELAPMEFSGTAQEAVLRSDGQMNNLWPHFPLPSGKLSILRQPVNLPNLKQWRDWPQEDEPNLFDDGTLAGRLRIFLRDHPGVTASEIQEALPEDRGTVSGTLGCLKQKGHVYTTGQKQAFRYFLDR